MHKGNFLPMLSVFQFYQRSKCWGGRDDSVNEVLSREELGLGFRSCVPTKKLGAQQPTCVVRTWKVLGVNWLARLALW